MDDATIQILIEAKNLAGPALEQAKMFALNFKEAIDSINRTTAEGVPIAEAARRAIGELSRGLLESTLSAKEQTGAVTDMRQALTRYIEAVDAGMAPQAAATAVLDLNTQATVANTTATQANTAAATAGVPAILAVVAGIALAVAALMPFIPLVLSATVALISFTVGAAGIIVLLGGMAAGFAAMAAAVVLLGGGGGVGAAAALANWTTKLQTAQEALVEFDQAHKGHLTILQQQSREQLVENIAKAQQSYNDALAASQGPTGVLIAQLTAMKDALAAQATPLAALITQWIGSAIPAIQGGASALMTWFGDRLPGVLKQIGQIIKELQPDFAAFGGVLSHAFDQMSGQATGGVVGFFRLVLQAAEGLITNLLRLSGWFIGILPTLGPIVGQIFGGIGSVIQGVATIWGQLTDFVIKNWPFAMNLAKVAVKEFSDKWNEYSPMFNDYVNNILPLIVIDLEALALNFGNLAPVLQAVLSGMLLIAAAILAVAAAMEYVIGLAIDFANALPGGNVGYNGPGNHPAAPGHRYIAGATGFSGMVTGPTLFLAGEGGSPEHVQITPQGGGRGGGNVYITVQGHVMTERDLLTFVQQGVLRLDRANR